MRTHHRRSYIEHNIASKRLAVALCAAIAMVLGAMSVGATIPFASSAPEATVAQTTGERSSITPEDVRARAQQQADPSFLPSHGLTKQQVLTPSLLQNSAPLLLNPSKPQIDVSLGPINTLIDNQKIQLKIDVPVLTPLTPAPDNTDVITQPAQTTESIIDGAVLPPLSTMPNDTTPPPTPEATP